MFGGGRVSVWEDEKVLETIGGDGCTTMRMSQPKQRPRVGTKPGRRTSGAQTLHQAPDPVGWWLHEPELVTLCP